MRPPIIFFHSGFDPYISFALWQAKKTNPGSEVILLGDHTNDVSCLGIRHVPYSNNPGRRDEFVSIYKHFSHHELECERLCIERWFYLAAFVEKEKIDQFFYLDSDVITLLDLSELIASWGDCLAAGVPHFYGSSYISKRKLVTDFCDCIISLYHDPAQIDKWQHNFETKGNTDKHTGASSVNDMALCKLYEKQAGFSCVDLREPHNGVLFDENIILHENILHCPKGFKQAFRDPKTGSYFVVKKGQPARLACLHFAGNTKRYESAFVEWSKPLLRSFFKPNYRRNIKKLIQYAFYGWQYKKHILQHLP